MNDSTRAVLETMRFCDGACARTFAESDIYRFGARIYDLRQLGYRITKTPCRKHHHRNVIWEYQILSSPGVRHATAISSR